MDVKHIAKLANLPIKPDQESKLQQQFDATLKTISIINELDTSNIEPISQVTGQTNVTRPDIIDKSRILKISGYFKVPAIFSEQ